MTDLLFVALTVAFFVLCVGYVRACDRIVSRAGEPTEEPAHDLADESQAGRR